jgi:FKBP-type peptidyl-prolyl cis-trans isomerase FkpA
MLKNSSAIMIAFASALMLQSCNEYKKNDNGLRYKIVVDSTGKNGEIGGFLMVNYEIKNSKDSVLQSTFKQGGPMPMEIQKAPFKGGLEEGFLLLSQGDSAVFLVNSDSIFSKAGASAPKGVDKGSDLKFTLRVVKMFSKEDVKKEQEKAKVDRESQQKEVMKQLEGDTLTILNYLKTNKISAAKKTQNGVYYTVTSKGKGAQLVMGDSVSVDYVGKLFDGKEFDSGKGFPVVIGMSQVIYGWHEGLSQLKDGDKATLYIPSPLAYGKQGSGAIPPDANLIFEVEVFKAKK